MSILRSPSLPRPTRPSNRTLLLLGLLVLVAVAVAACGTLVQTPVPSAAPSAAPTVSPSPGASATPTLPPAAYPLVPAKPGTNPIDLLAWAFTPVFWVLFNALVVFYELTKIVNPEGNIAIAIMLLTLLIRALLVVPFRRQIVSQRRMQLIQPELRELQKRYKGDRAKLMSAQQQFYRERGVSPTSGCLPIILQFVFLIPMYSVISQGLTNFNPQAMTPIDLNCAATPDIAYNAAGQPHVTNPCLNPWAFGVDWGIPEIWFTLLGFGISALAIAAALLQLVQSRMTLPPADPTNTDPNVRVQRQMVIFLPFISIAYGGILPAGLFIYWIVTTVFSIVQQYLIIGWGSMFPVFGFTPGFARDHTPRFPVSVPAPTPREDGRPTITESVDRAASAASTIRSRQRGRQGRRGRRR